MADSTDKMAQDQKNKVDSTTSQNNTDAQKLCKRKQDAILDTAQALPFPNLFPAQKALLIVSYDPEHALKSITERCDIAGISRKTYYRAIHNPHYLAASKEMSRLAFEAMQPEMIARYTALAKSDDPGSGKAIERILEQGDHLKDKSQVSISLNLSAEQKKQIGDVRKKNTAEGLEKLGIVPPSFLQTGPSKGNGSGKSKSVGRITVRDATNDPINDNGRMQANMATTPPASTTKEGDEDDDF